MCLQTIQVFLAEAKTTMKEKYMQDIQKKFAGKKGSKSELDESLNRVTGKAVCGLAAKRLVNKALQVCKKHVRSLLKTVQRMQTKFV